LRSRCCRPLVGNSADFAIAQEDPARLIAQDVAAHGDAALFQLADPVGGQRAFIELGQLLDIFRARADQQFVDAGPDRRAVALAARLCTRGEHEPAAGLVQAEALQALLRKHVRHDLRVRDRARVRNHAIDADRDDLAIAIEHGGAERPAGRVLDVAPRQFYRQRHPGLVIKANSRAIDPIAQPVGQRELQRVRQGVHRIVGRVALTAAPFPQTGKWPPYLPVCRTNRAA
jgi:hypothetical protein